MKTTHSILAATVLFCGASLAGHEADPAHTWAQLSGKNLGMGLSTERVGRALSTCRENGLSVADADELLCPVYSAAEEHLPTDCVFLKIEEGLAKQVPWRQVRTAACRRLDFLRQAARLLSVRPGWGSGAHGHLLEHTCMALESGLPESVLADVINRPRGPRYGRLAHAVEAGEALHLAGLDPADTQRFMLDCMDRDLGRAEIGRAADYVIAEHTKGRPFSDIHRDLWNAAK